MYICIYIYVYLRKLMCLFTNDLSHNLGLAGDWVHNDCDMCMYMYVYRCICNHFSVRSRPLARPVQSGEDPKDAVSLQGSFRNTAL